MSQYYKSIKTGLIEKEGSRWRSWKKRMFELFDNGRLEYSDHTNESSIQKGIVYITGLTIEVSEKYYKITLVLVNNEGKTTGVHKNRKNLPLRFRKDDFENFIEWLYMFYICIIKINSSYKTSVLHLAIETGNENIVEAIYKMALKRQRNDLSPNIRSKVEKFEKEFSIHHKDLYGNTPLHLACDMGHTNIVQYLINQHTVLDKQTTDGNTPLHFACVRGFTEIAELLIEKDITLLDKQNNEGLIPVQFAIKYYNQVDFSKVTNLIKSLCEEYPTKVLKFTRLKPTTQNDSIKRLNIASIPNPPPNPPHNPYEIYTFLWQYLEANPAFAGKNTGGNKKSVRKSKPKKKSVRKSKPKKKSVRKSKPKKKSVRKSTSKKK
jgi:hypothetical protein